MCAGEYTLTFSFPLRSNAHTRTGRLQDPVGCQTWYAVEELSEAGYLRAIGRLRMDFIEDVARVALAFNCTRHVHISSNWNNG